MRTLFLLLLSLSLVAPAAPARRAPMAEPEAPSVLENSFGDLDSELEAVFAKMIAKTPDARHQSMAEVIFDLKLCQARLGSTPSLAVGSTTRCWPRASGWASPTAPSG